MTRTALPLLLAALVAGGSAVAAERKPVLTDEVIREETSSTPMESIADEAAIAGEGNMANEPADRDPMALTEDEMIQSADTDGCEGSDGMGCPGGDN
jgi:hypothetical protein